MEKRLFQEQPKAIGFDEKDGIDSAEETMRVEIETGTQQLETLLCSNIDRNFDKFELYVMRNILTIQPEDVDWVYLKHYEGPGPGLYFHRPRG